VTENSGPNQGGRFQPGRSGNPTGKPKGAKNHVTRLAERLFDDEAEDICRVIISKAKEGDMTAARLIVERLCPPRKDKARRVDPNSELHRAVERRWRSPASDRRRSLCRSDCQRIAYQCPQAWVTFRLWRDAEVFECAPRFRLLGYNRTPRTSGRQFMSDTVISPEKIRFGRGHTPVTAETRLSHERYRHRQRQEAGENYRQTSLLGRFIGPWCF